ncbi:hypothetical protein ACFLV7_11225 [Chloroflexota bacterium]
MKSVFSKILFVIIIIGFTSCSLLPSANLTPTQMPTEIPTNTRTTSPTSTITPDFTSTQQAIESQKIKISEQATATTQEQLVQETVQAETARQAQEIRLQEQMENFYEEADKAGIIINKDPAFIKNPSKMVSYYFSEGLLEGKNINGIFFDEKMQNVLGNYVFGRLASVMWHFYKDPAYTDVSSLISEHPYGNREGFIGYGKEKLNNNFMFPIRGTTIHGNELSAEINHIEYQFVKKSEFDALLSLAQKQNFPVIHYDNFTRLLDDNYRTQEPYFNAFSMIYFQGKSMIVIGGVDPNCRNAIDSLNGFEPDEEKMNRILGSINLVSSAMFKSIAGDKYGKVGDGSMDNGYTLYFLGIDLLYTVNYEDIAEQTIR